jgi:hypothetical protein
MVPPLRRMATSTELPPPSPSQAPSFSQPTLEADDFVRWGKALRSSSSGSGSLFGTSSGYSSVHGEFPPLCFLVPQNKYTFLVSRTSSEDSTLFPEDLSSEPEDSHSTAKPARLHSRRPRPRPSDSTSQNCQPPGSLSGHGKPGEPSQPKLVEMLKGVSEVLEENTRLKKKRLEREVRKSRLKARLPTKPYDVAPAKRVSNVSVKTTRRVSGALEKGTTKPSDPEPMSVDPTPKISRKITASKVKDKEVVKIPIEDSMDVDSSVTLGDVSMNENLFPESVGIQFKPSPSDPQSSAKRMPPPPVPPRALKQPPKKKSLPKPTPSKTFTQPPPSPTPLPLTQFNTLRKRTLGMTRSTTQTSALSRSVLPTNRKPFKSPLIKQEPGSSQYGGPPRSQSKMYPVPPSSTSSQSIYPTQKPAPTKSTPKPPKPKKTDPPEVIDITDDPDTSYDFSTSSIDGEEFNRAMAEYDRDS